MKYNIRDVSAVVEIEESKGVLDMYDHIRHVTGTSYSECADSNIGIIDVLFLRQAKDKGFALPTSTKPERGWYYGGKVFNPIPGKHENVVYPDLASLYPYLMWSLNVSPETVFDTLEEARAAGYEEDDLYRASVDRRDDDVKRDSDPERSDIYYTKPDVKEGFVREVIDDLVSMKYEYKKPQYSSEKYGAVKRIVNSCFTPDTDVLTPDGVKKITEIGVGDTVYSWNKETGVMEEKPVTETIEKPKYDGGLVHIQNRNIDLKVTPDHRMLVKRTRYSDEWETVDAGELNEYTQYETPNRWTYEHANGIETVDLAEFVDDSFEVTDKTITAGENHTTFHRFVDGDAFIELLGWYITEGSVYISSEGEARGDALTISQYKSVNDESYNRIVETVEELGVHASQAEGEIAICGSLYSHIATSLCGSGSENKHIPDFIFEQASGRQKQMLFDVLMLGDGDKNRNRYSTQSTQLRDDVIQLCWQLGKKPQYRYDDSGEFNTGVWRVHFTNDDTGNKSKQSFRMHRAGDTETAENGVYCIQVKDNHTLVAGRNGKFTNIWNCYGVFGDSASYGKGFRLFDWRLAETITLAGQKVVTYTSNSFERFLRENGHPDAKRVGGDSVPANEPTLVNRGSGPEIISIEDVCVGDSVWSHEGWTTVKDVIKKPNRKKLYTVATKSGITHVTEDHSLVRDTMEEVPPKEVSEGDALLHKDIASVDTDELDFHEKRAWLLGLFAAEGSCGIYECESGSKASWAINNSERAVLEEAQEIMSSVFGIQTKIDDVMKSSNTMKLRLYGNVDNASIVLGFREMLYNGTEKRVPKEILQSSNAAKRAFVAGYHTGDGHIAHDSKEFDEMWTKHKHLGAGIVFLLRQLGHKVTLSVRTRQESEYYRIRAVGFHQGSAEEVRTIEEFEYSGEYVYDLETESHHFQSGIGSMIVHNTDSVMTKIPSLDVSPEEIQEDFEKIESGEEPELPLFKAAQYVNDSYDQFMHEEFWIDDPSMHKMEVEIESYADAIFFLRDFKSNDPNKGVKKRYSQLVTWDEGEIIENPTPATKGFELVRSDTANITTRVQERVLELLLKQDEPNDAIREYLIDEWEQSTSGEVDLSDIGIPSAISKPLDEYGGPNKNGNYTTPQPHIRGAKYANAHVSGESISSGDKPLFFYIDRVGYPYPDVYVYEDDWNREDLMTLESDTVRELGRDMDAIALNDVRNLPDEIHIDYEKMSNKTLRRPIEPIVKTMGWTFDDMITEASQSGLAQFM
jgi:DNA polymerase elongation subunit (family B)